MNHAEWRLDMSVFECRLWQPIPHYGDAVFVQRAGEQQRFRLQPASQGMREGSALLVSQAPVWDEKRELVELGPVEVQTAPYPVQLERQLATRLLHELYQGMSPLFTRLSWFGEDVTVNVALSSVNFRKAYRQYRDCLAGLLPVNYDQVVRSRIHFVTAKAELTAEARERLDMVVLYVKADTRVNGFFIDGHTDDVGDRRYNLELSKRRAEAVTAYLVGKGIDESLITTRYHGERYPVVKNVDAASRAQNRRVTLRLERDEV